MAVTVTSNLSFLSEKVGRPISKEKVAQKFVKVKGTRLVLPNTKKLSKDDASVTGLPISNCQKTAKVGNTGRFLKDKIFIIFCFC